MHNILHYLRDRLFIKQPRLRRFVTKLYEKDRDIHLSLCGASLMINTIKEHGYLRAWRLSDKNSVFRFEFAVIVNLAFLLDNQDTFVDVGANVGLYSYTIARFKQLYPNMQVYAFEANPDTYSRLIKSNQKKLIHASQIALSDHSGKAQFIEGAVSHVFTTTDYASSYNIKGEEKQIPCCRLDEFNIEGESVVIKIDVEGQELEVLSGATGLLDSGRVKAIYLDGYGNREVEIMLRDYGFVLFDGRTLEPVDHKVFSLLALHPDKCDLAIYAGIRKSTH